MGVHKTVIGRAPEYFGAGTVIADGEEVKISGGTGALALGVPGNIYDASPARIHTDVITEGDLINAPCAWIGFAYANKGVIVNPREYALRGNPATGEGPLAPSLMLPVGSTASFMTFGHVVAYLALAQVILGVMDGQIIVGKPAAFSTAATYDVGDIVTYNNGFYKCKAAVTVAGAWTDDTNWRPFGLADLNPLVGGEDTELCVLEINGFKAGGSPT